MRQGWFGNQELQKRLHRADPSAHVIVEAAVVKNEDVRDTKSEWEGADALTGISVQESGGGAKLLGNVISLASHLASVKDVTEEVNKVEPIAAMEIHWKRGAAGVGDPEQIGIAEVQVRVNPKVDSGAAREVEEWLLTVYRLDHVFGQTQPEGDIYPIYRLQQIGKAPIVEETGDLEHYVNFTMPEANGLPVMVGPPPLLTFNGELITDEKFSSPVTFVVVHALTASGSGATNAGVVVDSATVSESVPWGYVSTTEADLYRRNLIGLADFEETIGGERGEIFLYDTGLFAAYNNPGVFDFDVKVRSYTERTISFTGANQVDLGAAPTDQVELIAEGDRYSDSALTFEVSDDAGTTWYEYVDGDKAGVDNTSDGGTDLTALAEQQTYEFRVTLTPNSNNYVSPVVRRMGARDLDLRNLDGVATVKSVRWAVDPTTLRGEIPECTIKIIRDGNVDYRDEATELFSDFFINQMELRVYVGDNNLPRSNWLHVDSFVVDDIETKDAAIIATCLSPMEILRSELPPLDTANNERKPLEYLWQTAAFIYDDLMDNQLQVPERRIGPKLESTSVNLSKKIEDAVGKDELDAISYLSDGAVISSQGRIKFVDMFQDRGGVIAQIPIEEISVRAITPGWRNRIAEFHVPFFWLRRQERFKREIRTTHADALTKLGRARIDPPLRLEDEVGMWISPGDRSVSSQVVASQSLAESIAGRTLESLGPGLTRIAITSTYAHPYLEPGDPIAIETDRFVSRDPNEDIEKRGRMWLIGRVTAISDVMGRQIEVWVQAYADMLPGNVQIDRIEFADPRILDVDLSYDIYGSVDIEFTGNEDAESIKYVTSKVGYQNKTAVRAETAQAADDQFHLTQTGVDTLYVGEVLYVSALAYENADGTGQESFDLFTVKIQRVDYQAPDPHPKVSQSGDTAIMELEVEDPQGHLLDVRFKSQPNAAADFDMSDPGDLSWTIDASPYRHTETIVEKHTTVIAWAVRYTARDGSEKYLTGSHTYDFDDIPQWQYASLSLFGSQAYLAWGLDEDGGSIRYEVDNAGVPAGSTVTPPNGFVEAGRTGLKDLAGGVGIGDTLYVRVRGFSDGLGGGTATTEDFTAQIERDGRQTVPSVQVKADQVGAQGQVTLVINDPLGRVIKTAFKAQSGGGDYDFTDPTDGSWDSDTTSPFTLQKTVTLVPKHASKIGWAVGYIDDAKITKYIQGSEPFDLDVEAEVTGVQVSFDASNQCVVSAQGDEDASQLNVTVNVGSDPVDPTLTDNTILARSGTVNTGIVVQKGQTAHVKVVASNGGTLGPVVTKEVVRDGEAPTTDTRYTVGSNKDAVDVFSTVESAIGENCRLHVRVGDGSGLPSTEWSLVQSGVDSSPRYVADGTELGPTDWFHDGSSFDQILDEIALLRDLTRVVALQAEGADSGQRGPIEAVALPQAGQPWLESLEVTFDEGDDKLKVTAVGGAHIASGEVDITSTLDVGGDPDWASGVSPNEAAAQNIADGGQFTWTYDITAPDREKTWYARVTPYNGAVVLGSATGLAGVAQRDSVYVGGGDPPDAGGVWVQITSASWQPLKIGHRFIYTAKCGDDIDEVVTKYTEDGTTGTPSPHPQVTHTNSVGTVDGQKYATIVLEDGAGNPRIFAAGDAPGMFIEVYGQATGGSPVSQSKSITPDPPEHDGSNPPAGPAVRAKSQAGAIKQGDYHTLRPLFDVDDDTGDNNRPRLRLRDNHGLGGLLSGTITPDMTNGPVQYGTLGGAATLAVPTNMVDGESIQILLDLSGNTLSFATGWKFPGGDPSGLSGVVVVTCTQINGAVYGVAQGSFN